MSGTIDPLHQKDMGTPHLHTSKCNMSISLIMLLLLAPRIAHAQQSKPTSAHQIGDGVDTVVLYTGKLFGYFRDPDKQVVPNQGVTAPNKPAQEMLKYLAEERERASKKDSSHQPTTITVGMGDNFSPDLDSRFVYVGETPLLKSRHSSTIKSVHDDNVATFLWSAKYDAIVPGREDFHFGASRLRALADALRRNGAARSDNGPGQKCPDVAGLDELDFETTPRSNSLCKPAIPLELPHQAGTGTAMLAANLVLVYKDPNKTPHLESTPGYTVSDPGISPEFGSSLLPGWQVFTFSDLKPGAGQVVLCLSREGNPEMWDFENCAVLKRVEPQSLIRKKNPATFVVDPANLKRCSSGDRLCTDDTRRPLLALDGDLLPNTQYAVCVRDGKVPWCKSVRTSAPFTFSRWIVIDPPQGNDQFQQVAVFGVVDGDLRAQLTKLNAGWECDATCAPTAGRQVGSVEISVLPPEDALKQTLEQFHHQFPNFKGRKVLLAQMPLAAAMELSSHLVHCGDPSTCQKFKAPSDMGFDLVISRAEDAHATRDGLYSYALEPETIQPTMVVTPAPAYNESIVGAEAVPGLVAISNERGRTFEARSYWKSRLAPPKNCEEVEAQPSTQASVSHELIKDVVSQFEANMKKAGTGLCGTQVDRESFVDAVLHSMLARSGADVALLQQRDLYLPDLSCSIRLEDFNAQNVSLCFERVLWKGDLMTTISVTGKQLKALLDQSDAYQKEEGSASASIDVKQRSLYHQGVLNSKMNGTPQLFVNAEEVKSDRIYKVVTSNHVAYGDTDYAAIASDSSYSPNIFTESEHPLKISTTVCELLRKSSCELMRQAVGIAQPSQISISDYADPLPWADIDNRPRKDYMHTFESKMAWSFGASVFKDTVTKNPDEYRWQHRPIHRFELLDLSGAFQMAQPNRSDASIGTTFGGIQNAKVTAPHSSSVDLSDSVRYLWQHRGWDIGAEQQLSLSRQRTGSLAGDPDSVAFKSDSFAIGPLIQFHVRTYKPRRLLVIDPIRFSTPQLAEVPIRLKYNPPVPGAPPFSIHIERQWGIGPRAGYRYEHDLKNFYEVGLQTEWDHQLPTNILIFNNGTLSVDCALNAAQTFGDCLKASKPTIGPTTAYKVVYSPSAIQQRGSYWTASATLPLPAKFDILATSQGDFFFGSGTFSTQTRYDALFNVGMEIPTVGNLKLTPGYEIFLFENQVASNSLTRRTFTIKLSYTFERVTGVSWSDAIRAQQTPSK